jgi:hypothetical protein
MVLIPWQPSFRRDAAIPLIAMFADSLPPEVKTTSDGEQLISDATCSLALLTAFFTLLPAQ